MTPVQFILFLRKQLPRYGSQNAMARAMGISGAYLSDLLNGKREPGEKVLNALGLERVVRYEKREGKAT